MFSPIFHIITKSAIVGETPWLRLVVFWPPSVSAATAL